MKRFFGVLLFTLVNVVALIVAVSCSNNTPNSAFQGPVQTISANNPTWSPTPTSTFTLTPTATPAFPVSGFNNPYALALVPTTGVEYVGDNTNNGLIRQYNSGILNSSWPYGKQKPVSGAGVTYAFPRAVAADYNGNIYVVGSMAGVYKYLSTGDFGAIYNTSAGLNGAFGVACSGSQIFVSDTNNQQIIQFPITNGAGTTVISSLGYSPNGLAVNYNGNKLYVAGQNGNVYIYTYSTYSSSWSLTTTIPGFSNPYAVAVDSSGDVFVSDTGNRQIEEFTSGNYNQAPANVFGVGTLSAPEGIALDSSNNIYVVDYNNGDFYEFAP